VPYADVNGQRLFYEDSGPTHPGDQPAVVFSHGLFMDHSMFAPQVVALRDRYRCIVWDERGHGDTGDATGPFTYWDSADDLAGLLGQLGVEHAVLGGMSQGGFLSLRAALAHPGLVRALILIDTQAGTEDPERLPYYQSLVERWTTQGPDQELLDIIAGLILGQGYADTARWQNSWRLLRNDNLIQLFTTLASREDIHDRLAEIDVPAIVIHGEQDVSIPVERAQQLVDGLSNSELVLIPGAGHASNLTHPDLVTPQIEAFLARLPD
jgi:pimeloyl-ACP methyl ester carboxylesterase